MFRSADVRRLGRRIDLETRRTSLFGHKDFEAAFRADIDQAQSSIVIFSGFVTPERVASYGDLFRQKILDGVKVRCVTRPPQYNGSIPPDRGREALDALEGIGVLVDCRREIHQKIAIIDGKVVWLGSLNPLSHTTRTEEIMMRVLSPSFASELARQVQIRSTRQDDDDQNIVIIGENPRCGNCGHRTYYFRSQKKGQPFFACESGCNWLQDANSIAADWNQQGQSGHLPQRGPACPSCGKKTRRQQGRFGPFYGCTGSKCDRTMNIRQATELMLNNSDSESETPAEQ